MTRASGRMLTTMERLRSELLTISDDREDACPDRGHQADFVIAEQDLVTPAAQSQGEAA